MCMNSGSDQGSGGTTTVTTTDKNFDKGGGKGGNNASAKPAPVQANQKTVASTPGSSQIGGYTSDRGNHDPFDGGGDRRGSDPYVIDRTPDKDKGGKGGGKGGGGKGGGGGGKDPTKPDKGGGGGGGGKTIEKKFTSISNVFDNRRATYNIRGKGGGASGADTFASGSTNLTGESPRKNNLTLSSRLKGASLRPSIVS